MKAKGYIQDYGIELVEALNGAPKVVVKFMLTERDPGIKYENMKWEGFFVTTKGEPNKNTIKSLVEMGFKHDDPIMLAEENQLDFSHEYFLTIEEENGYQRIRFVNRKEFSGGMGEIKKASKASLAQKLAAMKLKGAFVKQKSEGPIFDNDDEIPF